MGPRRGLSLQGLSRAPTLRPRGRGSPAPPTPACCPNPGTNARWSVLFRPFRVPGLGMQLLRGLRLWGLGAYADRTAAARGRAARHGPRPSAPPTGPGPRPGLLWARRRGPLSRDATTAAACRDPLPASADSMERPEAGEPGLPSWPRGATGAGGRGPRAALGLGKNSASPPHSRPPRVERDPTPAQRGFPSQPDSG